jgi:hypothetical protein
MDEDHFNLEIRKFLKTFGVSAQRAIEQAVRDAAGSGRLTGDESLKVDAILRIDAIALELPVSGTLELERKP